MTESLAWPRFGFGVLDRLACLGAIQVPTQVLPRDDAEDLDVDDVRGGVIHPRSPDQHLTQT
ncbi:MAG: hypothetical protein ACR2K2_07160 [Mycobacteriales bacterium]